MLSPAGPSSICTHFIACILVGAQCTFQGTWEMGMVTKSDVDSMEQGRGEERREEVFTLEEGYCTDRRWREKERSRGKMGEAPQCPFHLVKFFQVQTTKSWRDGRTSPFFCNPVST